jgi:DNA helicase-4
MEVDAKQAQAPSISAPVQYLKAVQFNEEFAKLLRQDKFIARSDYKHFIGTYKDIYQFFASVADAHILEEYASKNGLDVIQIKNLLESYSQIQDLTQESALVKKHNSQYVANHIFSEQEYLDNILKACDPAIMLDNEQREVILSEEDNTLVIAGAGAGKTTTVAAKVRYLVEKRGIQPEQILVISFTNKAVEELRERINHNLKIPSIITTFHSIGYSILRQGEEEQRKIVDNGFMYNTINEYLKTKVLRNPQLVDKLILFFGSYFSAPYEGDDLGEYFQFVAEADYSTLKSDLQDYVQQVVDRRTRRTQTLNNEVLRSMEEVQIANFLYLNQIDYEYEPMYQYRILSANKPYTPDFRIKQGDKVTYIEHFGITEDGRSNRYTPEQLQKYKSIINDKVSLHRKHKTDLIYTFSQYRDGREMLEHLQEMLLAHGYELHERPTAEVYKRLVDSEENKYITRLTQLICTFIGNFKTQGFKTEKFADFKSNTKNVRTKLFLDICEVCYLEYQQALKEQHCIDFEDMINESAELIRKKQIEKERLDYKYIIVDEYQDISRQRYNLIKELSILCDAKIMAVGDDWQSIYAFSGSILPLFTRFCEEVGYGQELKITRTYRNAQEIIDIAGTFVQKNSQQIKKELISPKRIDNPVIISTYGEEKDKTQKGGVYYNLGVAIENAIGEILEYNTVEGKTKIPSILLIGRYGFDARNMCRAQQFNYNEDNGNVYSVKYGNKVKLNFMTAHSSKGLTAENVIIINAKDETYGFPSKVDDDPVLNLVVSFDTSYNYAEERRLFYVALTRTKNRVFIVTPDKRPSEFIKELLSEPHNYPNVTLRGELKVDLKAPIKAKTTCPKCGYPMQFKYSKNYGLKLWICTNDQELCGFMTNDKRGGELSIHKCDWCKDGYLVVKKAGDNFFLGCTNYKPDKTGCGRMINAGQYEFWYNDSFGMEDASEHKPSYFVPKQTSSVPKIQKAKTVSRSGNSTINTISYKETIIENEVFRVIVDSEGKTLTDMNLLGQLRTMRSNIAVQRELPSYYLLHNNILVLIATDKPITREELMSISGFGLRKWEVWGDDILKVVSNYLKSE